MAFSSSSGSGPMADINIIPLADVMLVLLIIFMVTAPPTTYEISVDLPQRSNQPPPPSVKDPIKLRIDGAGQVSWNGNPQPLSALQPMMAEVVQQDPTNQPLLEIDTDPNADYGVLAKVLASAKNAQMVKIGFLQDR